MSFCIGVEEVEQRNLKRSCFEFAVNEPGKCYVTMTHDEATKNHLGGLQQDRSSFKKTALMYETESDTDGYRALSLYISKLNPKCEALFQLPRRDWNEATAHNIWYENRPLGVNTLGNMMREMSAKAMLSRVYTNHCVWATAITLWSEAGLPDRHICHISDHRNANSLQHYNSRPSSTQLRKCSDVLSSALQGSNQTTQMLPQHFQPVHQLQSREMSTATDLQPPLIHSEMIGGMFPGLFNSCTINSVQINMNPPKSTSQ